MFIAFVIWTLITICFWGIGIYCLRAKDPVGFFTGVKPPRMKDTKAYNQATGKLWLVTGCLFEGIGIPFLFLKQNSPFFVLLMLATIALLIGMMIAYVRIEGRYRE